MGVISDVARVDAYFIHARFGASHSDLVIKMNIRHNRHFYSIL